MVVVASATITCEHGVMARKQPARATETKIETALLLAADLQFRSIKVHEHGYSEDVLTAQIQEMTERRRKHGDIAPGKSRR